ncbi:Hypothetical predicted protein [Podarcis lilfordi]|uniref:Uncharacterized protein n=1 Tax=Podarcis lilfordi TaxID=74358 RepID=A0AA35K4U2_9SAUR|nr:Hypothetical predicted protein [Podarcis lilfordi]
MKGAEGRVSPGDFKQLVRAVSALRTLEAPFSDCIGGSYFQCRGLKTSILHFFYESKSLETTSSKLGA